jgi:formylglycine-generating enzyme required for sulfatase activity
MIIAVLSIYFFTPVPELIRTRIDEILNPPQTDIKTPPEKPIPSEQVPTPTSKPTSEPVQLHASGSLRDRLKSGGHGPIMMKLPDASFMMGNEHYPNERPVIKVTLKSFLISKYEITFNEYERFMRDIGGKTPEDKFWGRGNRPVINVSWQDAVAYTEWLTTQTGYQYRLPSEREWEFAATGGRHDLPYWWGTELGQNKANCAVCGSEWDNLQTAPVGSFGSNNFELHDTVGNVLEWTLTCFHPNYQNAPNYAQKWEGGDCSKRMVRGSAFDTPTKWLRATRRLKFQPTVHSSNLGFRVVRVD